MASAGTMLRPGTSRSSALARPTQMLMPLDTCTAQHNHVAQSHSPTQKFWGEDHSKRQLTWTSGTWAHRQTRSGCCTTVLCGLVPQLWVYVYKLNCSPGWENISWGKQYGWGQCITVACSSGVSLRSVIAPTQQKQRLKVSHAYFMWNPVALLVLAF